MRQGQTFGKDLGEVGRVAVSLDPSGTSAAPQSEQRNPMWYGLGVAIPCLPVSQLATSALAAQVMACCGRRCFRSQICVGGPPQLPRPLVAETPFKRVVR